MATSAGKKAATLTSLEIATFFKELSLLFESGISLSEAAYIMADHGAETKFRPICRAMAEGIQAGHPLADCAKDTAAFPLHVIHMLKVGQSSGKIDAVLAGLTAYYQRQHILEKSVKNALTYPLIMITVMFAVLATLIIKVLPMFGQVFQSTGAKMPLMLQLITSTSWFSPLLLILLALLLGVAIVIFVKAGRILAGGAETNSFIASLPIIKAILEKTNASQLASGISLMLAGGMSPEDALMELKETAPSKWAQARATSIIQAIDSGDTFAAAASRLGIWDSTQCALLAAGERAGKTDEIMELIAARCTEEVDDRIGKLLAIIEPTLVIIMCLVIGIILLSIMLPLMNIMV